MFGKLLQRRLVGQRSELSFDIFELAERNLASGPMGKQRHTVVAHPCASAPPRHPKVLGMSSPVPLCVSRGVEFFPRRRLFPVHGYVRSVSNGRCWTNLVIRVDGGDGTQGSFERGECFCGPHCNVEENAGTPTSGVLPVSFRDSSTTVLF